MKKELLLEELMGKYSQRGFSILASKELSQDYNSKYPDLEANFTFEESLGEYANEINFIAYDSKQYILVYLNAQTQEGMKQNKNARKFTDKSIQAKQVKAKEYIIDFDIDMEERTVMFHYLLKEDKVFEKSAWRFKHERPETIKVMKIDEFKELPDSLFVINKEKKSHEIDPTIAKTEVQIGADPFGGKSGAKAKGDWSIALMAVKHHCSEEVMTQFLVESGFLSKRKEGGRTYLSITTKGERKGFSYKNTTYGNSIQVSKQLLVGVEIWSKWILEKIDGKKKAGNNYELFIAEHYENQGYFIKLNGFEKGKGDNSVDIIAIKDDEALLIQCKHWSPKYCRENSCYIKKTDLVSFVEDSNKVLDNPFYKNKKVKKLFIISYNIAKADAIEYAEQNEDFELACIPFVKKGE